MIPSISEMKQYLLSSPTTRDILKKASDLRPGSKAMESLMDDLNGFFKNQGDEIRKNVKDQGMLPSTGFDVISKIQDWAKAHGDPGLDSPLVAAGLATAYDVAGVAAPMFAGSIKKVGPAEVINAEQKFLARRATRVSPPAEKPLPITPEQDAKFSKFNEKIGGLIDEHMTKGEGLMSPEETHTGLWKDKASLNDLYNTGPDVQNLVDWGKSRGIPEGRILEALKNNSKVTRLWPLSSIDKPKVSLNNYIEDIELPRQKFEIPGVTSQFKQLAGPHREALKNMTGIRVGGDDTISFTPNDILHPDVDAARIELMKGLRSPIEGEEAVIQNKTLNPGEE